MNATATRGYGRIDPLAEHRATLDRHMTTRSYSIQMFFNDAKQPRDRRVVTTDNLEHHLQALQHSNQLRSRGRAISRSNLLERLRDFPLTKGDVASIDADVVKALGLKA